MVRQEFSGPASLCHSLVRQIIMQLIIASMLLLFIGYGGLMLYYRNAWKKIPSLNLPTVVKTSSIAIIIPARNEAERLPVLLGSLKNQQYPGNAFEVIVIDDHSTDNTFNIASDFRGLNITCIRLADHVKGAINSYKKKAIEIGIAHTQAELIITTDADCIAPPKWLKHINAFYQSHQPKMIIMPVAYRKEKTALDIFQSLDFMVLQGITGAAVHQQFHAMCNGANLAYTKNAFSAVNGFEGIDHIASGDDMLLLQKMSGQFPKDIHYLKDSSVIVETEATPDVISFFRQRIRWASKAGSYKDPKIIAIMLGVYTANCCLLFFPFLFLISNGKYVGLLLWQWYMICWMIKIISEMFFLIPVTTFFKKQYLQKWFVIAQPIHVLYTFISGTLGMFGKYSWKGRKVQ